MSEENKKRCVVSFSNSRGNYVKGMERLHESLRNNFDGTFLGFIGEETIGAPLHTVSPYAFKIYTIEAALRAGYNQIIYVDSSCYAIRDISPCFEEIEEHGFLVQDSGYRASEYINDKALDYFGVTREEGREIKLIGNAGLLGLDFTNPKAVQFFETWKQAMLDGLFLGEWNNNKNTESESVECKGHRHDMVSGIIIHQMGLANLIKSGDSWLQYAGIYDKVANETIIFKAQGL